MPSTGEDFARLYDDHVWNVYGFFGYRVGSRQEAEDLTQLTFEKALRSFRKFDERRASFGTWIMTIAKNALVDYYRSDRSSRQEPLGDPAEAESVMAGTEVEDEPRLGISPELEAALGKLGDREREVIALRFGGDMTGMEIAELTGLSVANVQQILSRTLRRLRSELEGTEVASRQRFAAGESGADD
jgi:RNA polymerase sigma factor (sigma-70 family)